MAVVRHGRATVELVPVFIDGHGPYMFLLDTGSSISSVSARLARELNLPKTGSGQIKGVVTSQTVSIVAIRAWKVGHVRLTPEQVAVLDTSTGGPEAGESPPPTANVRVPAARPEINIS